MTRESIRRVVLIGAGLFALGAILFFPRVLAFSELAARELRYLWWLVLLVGVAIWLTFFIGRRND